MFTHASKALLALFLGGSFLNGLAAQNPTPVPKAGRLAVGLKGKIVLIDPDNPEDVTTVVEPGKDEDVSYPTLSPDGKRLCYMADPKPPAGTESLPRRVMVRELGGKGPAQLLAEVGVGGFWGATANEVLVVGAKEPAAGDTQQSFVAMTADLTANTLTELTIPAGHLPFDVSRDGKFVVTQKGGNAGWKPSLVTYRVTRDGKQVEAITDRNYLAYIATLSPDGKTVVFTGEKVPDDPKKVALQSRLYVQPVGGKVAELPGAPAGEHLALCWSPDGKRIAYVWRQRHAEKPADDKPDERATEVRLYVCDADGKNHRVLLTEKGKGQRTDVIRGLDWR